jgi:hypothetical protein
MERADQVLKQDARGRVWTPPERREALLDEFERSGLPATHFAAHLGVKYQTFASWVQKRRKARNPGEASPGLRVAVPRLTGWVEATVASPREETGATLTVHLRGGAHLAVSNSAQALLAAQLLRALGEGGVC